MRNILIKVLKAIATLEDWSGRWVHYSEVPYLKVNPDQFHGDPAGIYLFPEEFKTKGRWENFPYKFVVELPKDANVLDLARVSRDEMIELVEHCFGYIGRTLDAEERDHLEKAQDYQDYGWGIIRNSKFMTRQAKWNKALRDLGYDAVFDDTGAVHSSEVQLIVLHPRKLKIVDMVRKSGSGFKELTDTTNHLVGLLTKYGEITVKEPKKRKGNWTRDLVLSSEVTVENDDKYATYKLTVQMDKKVPMGIQVSLAYSEPRLGYGSGGDYSFNKKEYNFDRLLTDADKIFKTKG